MKQFRFVHLDLTFQVTEVPHWGHITWPVGVGVVEGGGIAQHSGIGLGLSGHADSDTSGDLRR